MKRGILASVIVFVYLLSGLAPGRARVIRPEFDPPGVKLLASNATGALLEFSAPEAYILRETLADGAALLKLSGADLSAEPGKPRLPLISTLVGVPPDSDIDFEIIDSEQVVLFEQLKIKTAPFPVPIEEDFTPGGWIERPEEMSTQEISNGNLYPNLPIRLAPPAWMRDQRLVRIDFSPAQVLLNENRVLWQSRLLLRINFLDSGDQENQTRSRPENRNDPFDFVLKGALLNYDAAQHWRGSPATGDRTIDEQGSDSNEPETPRVVQPRYRIAVTKDGLYRLTYQDLKLAGVPVDSVNLTMLKMASQGQEVNYYYQDSQKDGIFNQGDGLVFYGQKYYGDRMAQRYANENAEWYTFNRQLPDGSIQPWKPEMNATMLEKYTDVNVYWLTVDGSIPGTTSNESRAVVDPTTAALMQRQLNTSQRVYLPLLNKAGVAQSYTHIAHVEESHKWKTTLFAGEETWFWEEITTNANTTRTYPINLSSVSQQGTAIVRGEIVAATSNSSASPDHHIQLFLNDPGQTQPVIDAVWDGKSRYRFEGQVAQSRLVEGQNQLDLNVILPPASVAEDLFVDWFEIEYQRRFVAVENQLTFQAGGSGNWSYEIQGFNASGVQVFDISDAVHPQKINGVSESGGTARFRITHAAGAKFIAGIPQDILAENILAYTPPDISQPVDYVIIAPSEFIVSAQILADYRSGQGLTSRAITLQDLYNEFNDGILNPIAIKNFLKYTANTWGMPPQYVLLVGDGHWNFKGYSDYDAPAIYMPPNLAWVDPWQGEVDSANLLATVIGNDPLPDVMIGRLPVNSSAELQNVINKIIDYENIPFSDWQYHLLFVADDTPDDAGDFVAQSNQIISDYISGNYIADKVYLDDFKDTETCNLQPGDPTYKCPAATAAIVNDLNQVGALIVNYDGHGAINYWADEQIFMNQDIAILSNGDRLPIMLSMTCLDGYWIYPNLASAEKTGPSLIEEMVRASQKGAVAAFSPTGLGLGTGHNALQRGFYDALFKNGVTVLGGAAQAAKLNLYGTGHYFDLLHTFTVFGDPALQIPIQ